MRSAIVTGVSRGIGRAVTEMLLADGWEVLGISRTMPDGFAGERRFYWLDWDLGQDPADYVQPQHLTGDGYYHPSNVLRDDAGRYDALIHCAGIRGPYGAFEENDPEAWASTIATNLLGTARVVKAALPALKRSEDARILLFSGGGAFDPAPGYSAYAASKGGTVALMETLAAELAETSVAVNCVAPGFVATEIHRGTPEEGKDDHGAMQTAVALVRHLLSPQTKGLTGRTISAQWDSWEMLSEWTIPKLGRMGTRDRRMISGLERLMLRAVRAM